jgi:hypothetical protein
MWLWIDVIIKGEERLELSRVNWVFFTIVTLKRG